MTETRVYIKGFHPLNVVLPDGDALQGKVNLVFPDVHVQLYDLSMGIDLLRGAHIGSDAPLFALAMDFPEPIKMGEFMQFLVGTQNTLEKMWKLCQETLDKEGALLRRNAC